MNKKTILLLLLSSAKYSIGLTLISTIFSLVPIDIIYYFLNRGNAILYRGGWLPLDWLLPISLVVGIVLFLPILVGGAIVVLVIGLYRTRISKKPFGSILGGVIGLAVFMVGTTWFLKLTEEHDLANWILFTVMVVWGVGIFSWFGHRIETLYSGRGA
jgi:hypothetical protein